MHLDAKGMQAASTGFPQRGVLVLRLMGGLWVYGKRQMRLVLSKGVGPVSDVMF